MPPASSVLARRVDGRVSVVTTPQTLRLTLAGLRSADGHDVTAFLTATLHAVDRPADVQLLTEQFLIGRDVMTVDDVRAHVAAQLTQSAKAFVAGHDVETALRQQPTFETLLLQRLDAIAFGCGLVAAGPIALALESDSLARDRQTRDARKRQLDEAEHAAALAAKLARLGPAHRLPASEQGGLFPALLAAAPPANVLLAAGTKLVEIDADGAIVIHAVPDAIGALRCVRRVAERLYAVGGTGGVALLNADLSPARVHPAAGAASGRGYNSVICCLTRRERFGGIEDVDEVLATHGEIGLTVWSDAEPLVVIATPGPARHLAESNGRVVFAAGDTACTLDNGDAVRPVDEGQTSIVAVLASGDRFVVVRRDGSIRSLDAVSLRPAGQAQVAGPVTAAAAIDVGQLHGLLLADDRGRVHAVTADGQPLARFTARTAGVRMIAVVGHRIVGVTADRASVLLWESPASEPRVINVLARTGHHVTDFCPLSRVLTGEGNRSLSGSL